MLELTYVSGTRADFGLMERVLRVLSDTPRVDLRILACGMHLMEEFGRTIDEVRATGLRVQEVQAQPRDDTAAGLARFAGDCTRRIADALAAAPPDMVLLQGDRVEVLAAAVAATYAGLPIAHTHGGDLSGTLDEPARHAITKLAHLHFTATTASAVRVRQMGEEDWRIHTVGAPGLDDIVAAEHTGAAVLRQRYCLPAGEEPWAICVHHPVNGNDAGREYDEVLAAVLDSGLRTICIYPNADAGATAIMARIRQLETSTAAVSFHPSVPRRDFVGLMRLASVMVGNSSAGIVEAPSLGLPAVNIGERQAGRERGGNVLDVPPARDAILAAVDRCVNDARFRAAIAASPNPYGDGQAATRIRDVLTGVEVDQRLMQKRFVAR